LVALEAMACGVPAVTSNAGGLPEVVKHGETGYLADIGDVDQMAAYALELLTDPVKHRRFSENGLKRAREQFSAEKIADEYEALYRRVLAEPRE
jgi:glycosyltransferase involved in cell wall biosynthesis